MKIVRALKFDAARSARPLLRCGAMLVFAILTLTGCQPGINWRAYQYNDDAVSRDAGSRTRFVYFRHWAVPACTKFEETVLLDPAVRTATQAYYCVVLAYNVDKPLAERWGVTDAPGVAMIGSNGRILETSSGFIDRNTLLALFKKADGEAPPAPASTTAPKP